MRIAQLIDSLTVGGAEKLLVIFARAVRDSDVDLTIVCLKPPRFPEIVRELEPLDVRLVTLAGSGLFDPRRALRLVRFLRRERFDAVYSHLTMANILGPIAARLAGVPCISTLHSEIVTAKPPLGALETCALRCLSHRVVAVGHAVETAHRRRLGRKRARVISNPVAPMPPLSARERTAARAELTGGDERRILMSTGMLTRQKAFGDLLEAFADLRRTHPDTALVIAGGGPLEDELQAAIEAAGLGGHARLLGVRDDVPRLLGAVDVYVSSSHWEGLPLSVLEAMSAGLPVVATAVGDLPAVMVEGTGILVEPQRAQELAAALRRVLDDPAAARRMGEAARAHVARHYRPEAWAERLLALGAELGGAGATERRAGR